MQDADQRVRALSANKQLLLAKAVGGGVLKPARPGLVRRPDAEPPPLSPQQRQLWMGDVPPSPLYEGPPPLNQSVCLLLEGDLDPTALRWAFRRLIERHETLRMDFPVVAGAPTVRIASELDCDVPIVDLSRGSLEGRQDEALEIARNEEQTGFSHQRGPLFRAKLFRLRRDRFVLFFLIDHILFDGWSFGIFVRELGALYAAKTTSTSPELPPLSLTYADYAHSESLRLTPDLVDRTLNMWRDVLAGLDPQPDLVGDKRTAPQPFRL